MNKITNLKKLKINLHKFYLTQPQNNYTLDKELKIINHQELKQYPKNKLEEFAAKIYQEIDFLIYLFDLNYIPLTFEDIIQELYMNMYEKKENEISYITIRKSIKNIMKQTIKTDKYSLLFNISNFVSTYNIYYKENNHSIPINICSKKMSVTDQNIEDLIFLLTKDNSIETKIDIKEITQYDELEFIYLKEELISEIYDILTKKSNNSRLEILKLKLLEYTETEISKLLKCSRNNITIKSKKTEELIKQNLQLEEFNISKRY